MRIDNLRQVRLLGAGSSKADLLGVTSPTFGGGNASDRSKTGLKPKIVEAANDRPMMRSLPERYPERGAQPRLPALNVEHHAAAMRRHSSAQRRHACAHSWQCACSCLAHSSPQASQTCAQNWQICPANSLPRAM